MKIMKLKDGRDLSYSDLGSINGRPVMFFHGLAGSRLAVGRFDEIAKINNYRLIAIDRPGIGHSTINKRGSILSTVDDIISLADDLDLDKFSVMGYSGGGVFATACAYLVPHRLNAAAIVSGMAPFSNPASHVGMLREQLIACKFVWQFPVMAYLMMYITRIMLNKSDKLLEKMIKPLPEIDKEIFRDPIIRKELINCSLESFRNGLGGNAYDMKLILRPWGFNLADITFPITIWHGAEDTQAPISHGKLYKQLIPNATLKIFENDGHHSIIRNHFIEILKTL
jgi:pimeloyl-ACP methyl ester carboxylesterase